MARSGPMALRLTGDGLTGDSYKLELGGKDISAHVTGVTVHLNVGEVNQATITYICEGIEVDGVFKVTHHCGREEATE